MLKDIIANLEESILADEKELIRKKDILKQLKALDAEETFATVEDLEKNWLSSKEAAEIYSKSPDTFRKAISYGNLVEGVDCKKSGRSWLFLKSSLDRIYGDKKSR